ncbi:MAG TPA: rRNA maturation RNase YbeY [Candidatus Pacebacteria bacterium]|nr:MAG: putative rRNA maturation factor [Microgenomates group bacterium GW2011_GWB1_45_17]KKU24186.1 MAG: putative rRNA maturation factor [Microgenomates group bacterium GW2011_GWC1_46_15]KKU24901.1 MAG: putative rRNA maturation factor [Microgenomates group bacterium GW2011_GWA1_46_15]HCR11431.1 rRNA maturation RNase YbeY [Candidatus Paceibacterota bacterium]HCR92386.1 rRNA maturation RNase YbeY [Candidatus Paceibacterota bacterium]
MIITSVRVGSRYPVNRKAIRASVERALKEHGADDVEVSVSIVGSRRMIELNEGLMKHEGVTDVLSFPQHDPEQHEKEFPRTVKNDDTISHIGDIVVCFPEAVKEARKLGKMVDAQICFLVEHGLMHLLGFHHD